MITETPIAFGLTLVVCLSLFSYCWYIRKLRYRLTPVQVSATPNEVHEQTGIKKEVVDTFPTVNTYELRVDIKDDLQCPICLIEYGNTELLRKLPFCGHVFHIHCVDSWLQQQVTCPVCRIVLTEYHPKPESIRQNLQNLQTLQTTYCRGSSTPNSVAIEISPATPAWMLVNRPLPLPPSTPSNYSESSKNTSLRTLETLDSSESGKFDIDLQRLENVGGAGESLLLESASAPGWGAVYLQRSARSAHRGFSFPSREADLAMIESKECVSHASISERWMTESFSFGMATGSREEGGSSVGCFESVDEVAVTFREVGRRRLWRSRVATKSWDFGRSSEEDEVVVEEKVGSLLPLTVSPEQCSFEFLPVVTGPGGEYSLTDFQR